MRRTQWKYIRVSVSVCSLAVVPQTLHFIALFHGNSHHLHVNTLWWPIKALYTIFTCPSSWQDKKGEREKYRLRKLRNIKESRERESCRDSQELWFVPALKHKTSQKCNSYKPQNNTAAVHPSTHMLSHSTELKQTALILYHFPWVILNIKESEENTI